jgi:hypothetical protein
MCGASQRTPIRDLWLYFIRGLQPLILPLKIRFRLTILRILHRDAFHVFYRILEFIIPIPPR